MVCSDKMPPGGDGVGAAVGTLKVGRTAKGRGAKVPVGPHVT